MCKSTQHKTVLLFLLPVSVLIDVNFNLAYVTIGSSVLARVNSLHICNCSQEKALSLMKCW